MKAFASGWSFLSAAVLLAGCGKKPPAPSAAAAPSTFTIRAVTAERSGDHLHLTVAVLVKNPGSSPLTLTPPAAQLWIGKEKPAGPFIAPGLESAVIAAGAESEAASHWWLAASDLSGSLELEIAGTSQIVKSTGDFVLDSLAEGQSAPLAFPRWKTIR